MAIADGPMMNVTMAQPTAKATIGMAKIISLSEAEIVSS